LPFLSGGDRQAAGDSLLPYAISTGTPGCGTRREPQLFMKAGDMPEVRISGTAPCEILSWSAGRDEKMVKHHTTQLFQKEAP